MRSRTETINRQRAQLRELQENSRAARDSRRRLMEWFVRRRPVDHHCKCGHKGCETETMLPPIDLIDWRGDGEVLPVVAGEMFVRVDGRTKSDIEQMSRTLEELGWSSEDQPDGKKSEESDKERRAQSATIMRFVARDRGTTNLKKALRVLEELQWRASPNHILPLNWVVKDKAGPEVACETLGGVKESNTTGAPLIAVDTGLASLSNRDRNDGRLASADGDEDLLDEVDRDGNLLPDGCLDLGAGHGTSVAGVAESVHPDLVIKILRALGPDGIGDEVTIAEKIREAAIELDGCGVINLSFGSQSYNDKPPVWLEAEIEKLGLTEEGSQLCVVAAAGNWGDEQPSWPAALPGVIAVAGLTEEGGLAEWSSRGKHVKFSAQAEGIVVPYVVGKETPGTDDPGDPYDEYSDRWDGPNPNALWLGTSFAAPQVAAELAHYLGKHPAATCEDAVHWLEKEGRSEPAHDGASDGFGVRLSHLWKNRH